LEETYQALRKIGGMQYNRTLCNAALVGVAAGFAMMFGGSFLDVAATAVVGVLLAAIITLGEKVKMNVIIIDILSSIGIAILAIAMKTYGMKEINMDTVIISAIMPLVPGVAITNAIRDTLQGDYLSGGARVLEAFLKAASIALGVGIGMALFGAVAGRSFL